MIFKTLEDILRLKESKDIEFKKAKNTFPEDAWKTYSAFANTSGGYLILGVSEDNDGQPVLTGVKDPKRVLDTFCSTLSNKNKVSLNLFQNDYIKESTIDNHSVISIYIPEADLQKKPVYINNNIQQTFLRVHSQDHKVDNNQLGAMLRNQSDKLDYELLNNYDFNDLDIDSITSYKNLLHNRYPMHNYTGMNNPDFLENIGVLKKDRNDDNKLKLTVGGLLFFGKYTSILEKFPHYHVDFFDKRGSDNRWRDRIESGNLDFPDLNLFNYYKIINQKLMLSIDRDFELDEHTIRKTPTDLSEAIRESFVNMIIHADYFLNTTPLVVEIHQLYYLFTNPGVMKIPVEEFLTKGARSLARNPLLVTLFSRIGVCERAGSGSKTILDVVAKNKFKIPEITTTIEKTILKLWVVEPYVDLSALKEDEKLVFTFLNNNGSSMSSYSKKEIQIQFQNITPSRLARILDSLCKNKLIMKLGGKKNRTYARSISSVELIHQLDKSFDWLKHTLYNNQK